MKVPGSNRVVSISHAVPLERPSDSTFSISQNYPGLCGRWAHKPGVGEAGTAVARLHCLLGAKSSRFGVKGGQKSTNVVQCRPIFFSWKGVFRAEIGGFSDEIRAEIGGWKIMTVTE